MYCLAYVPFTQMVHWVVTGIINVSFFFWIGREIACSLVGCAGTETLTGTGLWSSLPSQDTCRRRKALLACSGSEARQHLHLSWPLLCWGVGLGRTRASNGMSCLWDSLSQGTAELLRQLNSIFPCRSLPTELFKSTFIFPIHHPEPQSFACSSQMSSYEALCGPRSCVIPSPHHVWKVWESSKKAAQERKAGRDLQGTLLRCPRIPQKQEELQQLSWARKGTEAVHLTTDGPHFPQSTFESPLKAPALLLWGTHEMWGVLDAFSNSSKLRENRKINSNSKKGILKFGREKCSANPTRVWVSLHKATYGCIP